MMKKVLLLSLVCLMFTANALAQDAPKEVAPAASQEMTQDAAKEVAPAASQEMTQDAPKEMAKEASEVATKSVAPAMTQEAAQDVARATFATGIENREPVESITEYVPAEGGILYFFTEIKNMNGSKVSHVWHKNGEEIYSFPVNVKADRWRVSSSMKAAHFKAGDDVTVEVLGDDGAVHKSVMLRIR